MSGFNPLNFNVGFIAAETVGYVREIPVEVAALTLQDLPLRALEGSVVFDRVSKGVTAHVHLQAHTPAECIRCLQPFEQPLEIDFTELYAFSGKIPDAEFVFPENGQLNLAPLVREYMLLAFPMHAVCSPDCKGLCPVCGANLNEHVCNHEEESGDPRLAVLKALLE